MSSDGYVLTNAHVVEGADEIIVNYTNRNRNWESDQVRVTVPGTVGTPVKPSPIDLMGCTVNAMAGKFANAMAAQHAYLSGLQRVLPRDHLPSAPPPQGVQALDEVWEGLDALDPLAKQVMVEAITAAVSHDGKVSVAESELLRTLCGVLHCPLPAMLEQS